ncbi:hypothetical protein LTR37_018925 [Vermiconidia calcicola]|uniref:Uncharacterized protein n=1 Tax=Vermiconidia calcicola TaxID=1690605 RepID=A0ACC3MIL9_9PEZI|nr:hypothetical protein LTR37_018925 [Vermiconidia calcicola]
MSGYGYNGGFNSSSMDQGNQSHSGDMMMMGRDGMSGGMVGGQSLDEIVSLNAKAIRRQSMPQDYDGSQNQMDAEMGRNVPQGYNGSQNQMDADLRRMSAMDYSGRSSAGPVGTFQYDANAAMGQRNMMSGNAAPIHQQQRSSQSRRQSQNALALNTGFPNNAQNYSAMMQSNSAYQAPANHQNGFDMTMDSPYIDSGMDMQMDYNVEQNVGNGSSGGDASQMNLYNQPQFAAPMMNSPILVDSSSHTPQPGQGTSQDSGSGSGVNSQYSGQGSSSRGTARQISKSQSFQVRDIASPAHNGGENQNNSTFQGQPQYPQPGSCQDRGLGNVSTAYHGLNGPAPVNPLKYNPNNQGFKWEAPEGGWPSTMVGRAHSQTTCKNAYSSTGFDMLGVLRRVATRPNPEINIGAVDLSCAFVVCDAEKDDIPIVYCSDNFERLTGYTKHMILGRNCRFLQSPHGNVAPGIRRKYVDDDSVLYLKNMVSLRREAQISLINYRRGGQPFMNLLTIIPITWDTERVKFFVGFQVDLVEQPNAVTNKNPDGSYSINYQRGMTMPRYVMNAPESMPKTDLGQTVPRDDVSAILSTFSNGESEYAKRMWDKVLLENTDDVVHVLSLKGLFQWVSPSAAHVLEYEPGEMIGTALSSVCHPSDIVPVTRELKDTSSGATVNVVFRIKRKNSGYMWFEGHGSLHTEQGKGRKSIILVGRERPVYTLSKSEITKAGGIGENELWTKMSTSGMFLYVSSNVRQLLDRQPDELVGISIQSLMRTESKQDFGRILEHARTGKEASVKHEMINRRGQVLSAYTTLYPGDATEGLKPTFIVAQTRLIKFSRGTPTQRPPLYPKNERKSAESIQSGASTQHFDAQIQQEGYQTSGSSMTSRYVTTANSATTYAGQNGLAIGHQDASLASDDNLFDELKTTKSSSWQYEIRQLEKKNRILAEEVQLLIAAKKKRKRRRGKDQQKDCANCHTRVTPEWRRGPSGQRDLCNSCGLRWAKLNGRVSPRTSSQHSVHSAGASDKASRASVSPRHQPGPPYIKTEPPSHPQVPGGFEHRESPKATRPDWPEGHTVNMEGAYGVPDKIDEGVEEPE